MRNVLISAIFAASILLASCISSKNYVVESDYSFEGKFDNYKSFGFQKEINPALKNHPMRISIEEAIRFRLELQGYTYADENPDFYVAHRMYYDNFTITGYKQPLLQQWVRHQEENFKYDAVKHKLQKGTLMVIFRDSATQCTVWQGYGSQLFRGKSFDDERYVNTIITSIFDQYRVFANSLIVHNKTGRR